MKNFTFSFFLSILFALTSYGSYAQERCGMEEYMEEMMKDPEYARQYRENQKAFKKRLQQYLSNSEFSQRGGTIEIPVAVHFPEAQESERACLEALAQNQIDILNADYSATNSDFSNWTAISSQYPSTNAGVANISFCIALSNHPTGLDPELLEGNPCITIGYDFGNGNNVDSNWSGYLNFVIRNIGPLGFSPLGGSVSAGQAVTIDNNAFGSGSGCTSVSPSFPYNLGRTTTHELGHFFNLNHTFNSDGGGSCGFGGDGVADTPEVANSTYGCPSPPTSVPSCTVGQPALTMNYMDYVNDACMYMFSAGQISIADAYISGVLQPSFKPNVCDAAEPGFNLLANVAEVLTCPTNDNEATYTFSYTTVQGFSENTTFSATGLPAGAIATFTPSSLSSDGSFTMNVSNLGTTAQGTYTITVTGTSSPSSVTKTVDVVLNNNCTEIVCSPYSTAQNLNVAIPDRSGTSAGVVTNAFNVPDSNIIESMTVTVDISHTWISDLGVYIVPPGASSLDEAVLLWNNDCAVSSGPGNQNFVVTFDDEGENLPGVDGCNNNFTGTYSPSEPLSTFAGLDAQGNWQLLIADFVSGDTGTLNSWALDICYESALSLDENDLEKLSIYPNPNNGSFNVSFNSNSEEDVKIQVYDIRGRYIYNKTYHSAGGRFEEEIRLNNAQSGVYILNIIDGSHKVTKKIIVE